MGNMYFETMTVQELQNEKLELINWIVNLDDLTTIERIKSIQHESVDIPQWQKDLINSRLQKIENGEDKFYDFDEAIKEIEDELSE